MSGRAYDRAIWKRLREWQLRQEPFCRSCLQHGRHVPARHVDHIIPIAAGGDPWDAAGLQSLCVRCHSAKTRQEQTGRPPRPYRSDCDTKGYPTDPNHPGYGDKP